MSLEAISISYDYIIVKASLIGVLWICVLAAVLIDLYHGIKRSKEEGRYTSSFGLKRTVQKSSSYFTFVVFMLIADIVASIATSSFLTFGVAVLPIFNIIGSAILVWTEWVSVREKSSQKLMNRIDKSKVELFEMAKDITGIIQNNPGVLEEILEKYGKAKEPVETTD